MWRKIQPAKLIVQVDGALGSTGQASGLGLVVRDAAGRVLEVHWKRDRPQTNNEAEYRALIWALETLRRNPPLEMAIYSDSEVMVRQMLGLYAVHSADLKPLHRQARALAEGFPCVTYTHIPRDLNVLADALASEALWSKAPW
jgi:ribonuclease HI